MRLFVAILLPEAVKNRLAVIRDELHDRALSGTFVSRDCFHITLEFLGECSPSERDRIIRVMEGIRFQPFDIILSHTGSFTRSDGDICWVGVEENRSLVKLHDDLAKKLQAEGFRLEKKRFRAHITLARRVHGGFSSCRIDPVKVRVESISLMLSERGERGMIYTPVFTSPSASVQGTMT